MTIDPAVLHSAARDDTGPPPPEFQAAVAEVEAAERELAAAYLKRDRLIREARRVRVPVRAIERWTGLGPRRLSDIVNDETTD